jgi:hypothetical protein
VTADATRSRWRSWPSDGQRYGGITSRRNTVGARPIRERSSSHAKPNLDRGDAFAAAIPAVSCAGVAPALIAAQQVLSHLFEQFGSGSRPSATECARRWWPGSDPRPQDGQLLRCHGARCYQIGSAVDTKCNLAAGAVGIDSRPDGPNNDLILCCRHEPASCHQRRPVRPRRAGRPARARTRRQIARGCRNIVTQSARAEGNDQVRSVRSDRRVRARLLRTLRTDGNPDHGGAESGEVVFLCIARARRELPLLPPSG